MQLKRNYVQSPGSITAHNFSAPYTYGGHGYDLTHIHNLQIDFTPYSGLSYASYDIKIGPGFAGAYIAFSDNNNTTGTPYINTEPYPFGGTSHCHLTGYLRADGTPFANGSAGSITSD